MIMFPVLISDCVYRRHWRPHRTEFVLRLLWWRFFVKIQKNIGVYIRSQNEVLFFPSRIGKVVCVYYLDWILSNTINHRLKIIILGGSAVLIYWFSTVFGYYIYPFSCRIFKAEFEILFVFTIQIVYYPILSIIRRKCSCYLLQNILGKN